MRKPLLIALSSVVALVVVLQGLATGIGSLVARGYINDHGPSLIGRQIYIDDLSTNFFTGKLSVDSLCVYEADGQRPFVSARHIDADLALWHLLLGVADLKTLNIDGMSLNVEQRDTVFNFSDILTFLDGDQPAAASEASGSDEGLPVVLRDIAITNSKVKYSDLLVRSHFDLDPLNLHIPGVDLRDLNTQVGIELAFVEGGTLRTEVSYQERAARYSVDLTLSDFDLEGLLPYVQQYMLADDLDGTLDAKMKIQGSLKHVLDFNVNGTARVRDFEMEDMSGDEVLTCDSLLIGINEVKLLQNRIGLSHLQAYNPHIDITYEADSLDNFTRMMIAAEEAVRATAEANGITLPAEETTVDDSPWHLTIGQLQINEGRLRYRDNATPVEPFKYEVSRISMNAPQFSLQGNNNIKAKAMLGKKGTLTLEYHGKLEDQRNMQIDLHVKDVNLEDFSPYTLQMFGNEISRGTFSASLVAATVRSTLAGDLHLLADQPKIGKKQRKLHPEYNVPFRTGIYILTDKDGRCEFNLPLSGNVAEPQFSYKRVIFSTLGKLIVKVCTSGRKKGAGLSGEGQTDANMANFTAFDLEDIDLDQFQNDSIGQALMKDEMD